MKNKLKFLWSIVIFMIALSCGKNTTSSTDDRPYQPWVFRSVIDGQPRMITFALNNDLWASYHTDSCSLYQVWKGHVHFQGAVYDNAHGPQPITIGNAWLKNPYGQPWNVSRDGKQELKEARYRGHVFKNGHAFMMYDLICNDGTILHVTEQPEFIKREDGQPAFERIFTIKDGSKGYEISLAQQVTSVSLQQNISTNGKWNIEKEASAQVNGKQVLTLDGRLILNPEGETFFRTFFVNEPTIVNPNTLEGDEKTMSLGEKLIGKNDCKTCHNAKVQTIGPSFKQIAERYPLDDETVVTLSNKIIKGGAGIWGTQVMSAHPELPVPDAHQMITYILRLDTLDEAQSEKGGPVITLVTQKKEMNDLLPGLFIEVYTHQAGFEKIPSYSGQ